MIVGLKVPANLNLAVVVDDGVPLLFYCSCQSYVINITVHVLKRFYLVYLS